MRNEKEALRSRIAQLTAASEGALHESQAELGVLRGELETARKEITSMRFRMAAQHGGDAEEDPLEQQHSSLLKQLTFTKEHLTAHVGKQIERAEAMEAAASERERAAIEREKRVQEATERLREAGGSVDEAEAEASRTRASAQASAQRELELRLRDTMQDVTRLESERSNLIRRATTAEEQVKQLESSMAKTIAAYKDEITRLRTRVDAQGTAGLR